MPPPLRDDSVLEQELVEERVVTTVALGRERATVSDSEAFKIYFIGSN